MGRGISAATLLVRLRFGGRLPDLGGRLAVEAERSCGCHRIARSGLLILKPFRVEPGSRVSLAEDFDPGFKSGVGSKKQGRDLLARGIELLAEYQSRL